MSAQTSTTPAATPAVSIPTVQAFYDAFDAEFTRLQGIKNWCDEGRRTAYAMVPARPASASIPAEYLTDAGKAWQASQESTTVAELQARVRQSIRRYINDYLTFEEANEALTALGCQPFVRTTTHRGSFNAYAYFTTPARMAPEVRRELSDALQASVQATLDTFIAGHTDLEMTLQADSLTVPVESDRYADHTLT